MNAVLEEIAKLFAPLRPELDATSKGTRIRKGLEHAGQVPPVDKEPMASE